MIGRPTRQTAPWALPILRLSGARPVTVRMQSYAEFAIAETDGAVREDIEEIRRAAERAASLTRQLLIFSMRRAMKPEVLDVNGVVSETKRFLRRTLGAPVELVVYSTPGLHPVEADRGQLEQVLVNLALNARDASRAGRRLAIKTRTSPTRSAACHTTLGLRERARPDTRPRPLLLHKPFGRDSLLRHVAQALHPTSPADLTRS